MPVKGLDQVRRNLAATFERIEGPTTEQTLFEILIIGSGAAATLTPIDTSNLINSQYRRIERGPLGMWGRVGYTARYAAAVHNASGKLDGQPRPANRGDYWDPDAEPQFLVKGFERSTDAIRAAIKRGYKV